MLGPEDRYISLLTDFGFKRIFGTLVNKELLISFLNSLFDGREVVKDLMYMNTEDVGDVYTDRRAIFDVYCENEKGEKFIVEMQNAYQKYLKDRTLFYSTRPIREQAPKGADWDFNLKAVYTIALLNHNMGEASFDETKQIHEVKLCDVDTKRVFYEKLTFIYVEIAKFAKAENELDGLYDKWMYVLKNLSILSRRPKALQEKIFTHLFEQAEIAKFTPSELREYETSMKSYRDLKNSLDTKWEEGMEEGIEIGMKKGMEKGEAEANLRIANDMLADGFPTEVIMKYSHLSREEVEKLKG